MSSEILDSYGRVKIVRDSLAEIPKYLVLPPTLSSEEEKIASEPSSVITDFKSVMEKVSEFATSSEKEVNAAPYGGVTPCSGPLRLRLSPR